MNIVDNIHIIFNSMLPAFISTAKRYNVPNPEDWAREWQTNAYLIALKFDEGQLVKKGIVDGTTGLVTDIDDATFLRSFRGYLMTAYRNELNAHFAKAKAKPSSSIYTDEGDVIFSIPTAAVDTVPANHVYIEDVIPIIERDCKRNARNAETPNEACSVAFNNASLTALKNMQPRWEGIPILADIEDNFDSSKMACDFMPEWRSKTKFAFAHLLIAEKCPFTVQKMSTVLFSEQDFAITKRFHRYLFEYMGGMGARIRTERYRK